MTGAGGTLGDAFCRAYARDYDIVAVCCNRAPTAVSQEEWYVDPLDPDAGLPENAAPIFTVRADLERAGEVERVVDIALARFGRVDLLVNAAAYAQWYPQGLIDGDVLLDTVERHFAMNVGVPLRIATRLAQRFWLHRDLENRARNRNIVNLSSIAASRVHPGGQALDAASKAALNQLTRHLAADFGVFGVRANALAPDSFPAIVRTESVARAITELDQETITGGILVLDAPVAGTTT